MAGRSRPTAGPRSRPRTWCARWQSTSPLTRRLTNPPTAGGIEPDSITGDPRSASTPEVLIGGPLALVGGPFRIQGDAFEGAAGTEAAQAGPDPRDRVLGRLDP